MHLVFCFKRNFIAPQQPFVKYINLDSSPYFRGTSHEAIRFCRPCFLRTVQRVTNDRSCRSASRQGATVCIAAISWTGFYVGGNVGAGFGTTETSVDVGPALTAVTGTAAAATAPLVSETFNGFVGGVQAGYNWQAGVFVLGVEGDLDAAGLQGNAPCVVVLNCTMKHNWFADITGKSWRRRSRPSSNLSQGRCSLGGI